MNFEDILKIAATIIATLGGAGAIVIGLAGWLGKVWANRLMEADKAKHAHALEELRAELTKNNQSLLEADRAKYNGDLEQLRAKLNLDNQNALELVRAGYSQQLEQLKAQITHSNQVLLESERAKYSRELEELRATLNRSNVEFGAENKARRDYEYEARKRLYEQCEPLLFQLVELSENALHRIYSLARTARHGNLSIRPNEGWLFDTRNYYLASTVYNLMVPLVMYRLIQRNLTLVDLTVDPDINAQYLLVKRLYISFTDDYELANIEPSIEYNPNAEISSHVAKKQPEKYIRQAMLFGELDSLVDNLVKSEDNGAIRCMTYGEFEAEYFQEDGVAESFSIVAELFHDFHPKTRPVLWRILIAQAHIYEALIRTRESKLAKSGENITALLMPISETEKDKFEWRDGHVSATDEEAIIQPFDVAHKYLRKHLGELFEIHKPTASN
ncbi:MAG TPA: hypothetical protein VM911_01230 [Pyrinomonadaceae bacterium]|jgi:hypothetical protein|nr:hypothetical protein [Pyrinomonadaceae bacterium]